MTVYRRCRTPGCNKYIKRGTLCKKHGGKPAPKPAPAPKNPTNLLTCPTCGYANNWGGVCKVCSS